MMFIVQASLSTIVNYYGSIFIVHATGVIFIKLFMSLTKMQE
jgi:hypothetical protein